MRVGIALDDWKLPIFERHLAASGYGFKNVGKITGGAILLHVETKDVNDTKALAVVIEAAQKEAAGAKHA